VVDFLRSAIASSYGYDHLDTDNGYLAPLGTRGPGSRPPLILARNLVNHDLA
jgi:hypothetical protein